LYLLEDDGQRLVSALLVEQGQALPVDSMAIDDPVRHAARCARERAELVIHLSQEATDASYRPGTLATRSLLFAPLLAGDRLLGVLSVQSLCEQAYDEHARLLLRSLCAYVAIALDNASAYRTLSEAEAGLQRNLSRERELGQLKSRFVSMTSHEFRTPLAGILSSVDLLRHYHDRLPTTEREELFAQIGESVQRMTQMLDNILLIGRADAKGLEFRPARMDLLALCRELGEEVTRSRPGGNGRPHLRLSSRGADGEHLLDPVLLRHILGNLLSNAFKYSPTGGDVQFDIAVDSGRARFEIADQGIGIPLADQPRLFETFHRASNVGNISGTGLGLAIVKQSVQLHGGSIALDSAPGRGTRFTVELPLG
ncbi:MAG TPA: ATP-binding protein, partial [Arenimonas sp.]|nr:ATP-binding protein [Arenimonas sp.]